MCARLYVYIIINKELIIVTKARNLKKFKYAFGDLCIIFYITSCECFSATGETSRHFVYNDSKQISLYIQGENKVQRSLNMCICM